MRAAARPDDIRLTDIEHRYGVAIDRPALRFGGIIGRVELVDVVRQSDSKWFSGPIGFVLRDPVALPFTPTRGMLNLFDVSALSPPAE
jgi:hypothetical protein